MIFRLFILINLFFLSSVLSSDLNKVNLKLQGKQQFEFAGFYAAKELGYYKESGIDVNILEYENGVDISSEIKNEKADVVSIFVTDNPYWLQKKEISYNILKQSNYAIAFYNTNLSALEKTENSDAKLLKAFVEASNKGWKYALEHSEQIVELILKKYNTQNNSKKYLLFEADETKKMILSKNHLIGSIDKKQNEQISSIFDELIMIKSIGNIDTFLYKENNNKQEIELSKEEQEFIKNNQNITIGIGRDNAPFNFGNTNANGYINDLLNLISEKSGLKFTPIIDFWPKIFSDFKEAKINVIANISYKEERSPYTLFTTPYYNIPLTIYIRDDFKDYININSLNGKKVGVIKDIFYEKELRKIEDIDVIAFENMYEIFKALVTGKVDAIIQNLPVASHIIKENAYTNLKAVDHISFPTIKSEDLRFGINSDKPLLQSILQKTLDTLTQNEKIELLNRWFGNLELKENKKVNFTKEELSYLNKKNKIKYCFNPIYKPIEFQNQEGIHDGMTKDILSLISKRSGIDFIPVTVTNWSQTLKLLENKECEIIFALMPSPEREKYMLFTKSYLKVSEVLVNKLEAPFIDEIKNLLNQRIGILAGNSSSDIIKNKYPNFTLIEFEDTKVALDMVSNRKLDGFIELFPTFSLMSQIADTNLKIAGRIDEISLNIASHISEPLLHSILEKSLNSISEEEQKRITDKWMAIKIEKEFDYSLIWKIGILVLFIIFFITYLNYNLKLKVTKQIKELRRKDAFILEQSKNAALGELIANIAHQWRQPLANLNGIILNFDYENENNRLSQILIREHLNEMENLSLYMSRTIEDFSNFFNPKKEKQYFEITDLLNDIKKLFNFSITKSNIRLNIINNQNITINSYYSELLQIILVLINNAKDACLINKIEEPIINFSVTRTKSNIIFEVEDNAGGIPSNIINHIFEPYFTTKHKAQGTGLGLHIVKILLDKSINGSIEVVNTSKGAKFIIKFENSFQTIS